MSDYLDEDQREKFAPGFNPNRALRGAGTLVPKTGLMPGETEATGDPTFPGSPAPVGAVPAPAIGPGTYSGPEYGVLTENSSLSDANNPLVQAFVSRFGQTPGGWENAEYQNQQLGGYVVGKGSPNFSGNGIDEWGVDPTRVMYFDASGKPSEGPTEDGWFVIEGGNAQGGKIADMQSVDSRESDRKTNQGLLTHAATALPFWDKNSGLGRLENKIGPYVGAAFLGGTIAPWLAGAGGAEAAALGAEGLTDASLLSAPAASTVGAEGLLDASPYLFNLPEAGVGAADALAGSIPDLLPSVAETAIPDLLPAGEALADAGAGAAPAFTGDYFPVDPFGGAGPSIPSMPTIPGSAPVSLADRALGAGSSLIDKITGNPIQSLGVGASLYSLANAQGNKPTTANADAIRDAAKPISDQATDLLAKYGRGEINPADEFNINKWEHDQIAKVQSFYSRSGQGSDSTAAMNAVSQVQAQAQAMRETALKGLLQSGLQASGMALGPLIQAIQVQAQEDQQFAQATSAALNSLMLLTAYGSKTPPGTPPVTP